MARADRRRGQRARANAARAQVSTPRRRAGDVDPNTLFFERLRRNAKWVFVFLAVFFGGGFVLFGVGAGGVGVGDIFRNVGHGGGPSVSEARERVEDNPKNAQALRELATALQVDGDIPGSIEALERYSEVRPRDGDALRELAGLYLSRANRLQQEAQLAQLEASYLTGGTLFSNPLEGPDGQTLGDDEITQAVTAQANEIVTDRYTRAGTAYQSAEDAYERLVALRPEDPNVHLELAQTAQQGGNVQGALDSYEKFLDLAPDHPSAEIVRQQVEQLRASLQPPAESSG